MAISDEIEIEVWEQLGANCLFYAQGQEVYEYAKMPSTQPYIQPFPWHLHVEDRVQDLIYHFPFPVSIYLT